MNKKLAVFGCTETVQSSSASVLLFNISSVLLIDISKTLIAMGDTYRIIETPEQPHQTDQVFIIQDTLSGRGKQRVLREEKDKA